MIPSIFWYVVIQSTLILAMATLIGRVIFKSFPYKIRPAAQRYLSASAGLSILVVAATFLGKFFTFSSPIPSLIIFIGLFVALYFESNKKDLMKAIFFNTLFGLICGTCILVPLFVWGAYNSHNDTFTYLAHGNWLQTHNFFEPLKRENLHPAETQIYLYQTDGFRMGGSYLLGLLQGLFHIKNSLLTFPALLVAVISACFLSLGFSLSRLLKPFSYFFQFLILALPSLSYGGMVFSAVYGFMPQTLGISFSLLLLSITGPLMVWLSRQKWNLKTTFPAILIYAFFLTSIILSYSEFSPFVLATLGVCLVYFFSQSQQKWSLILHTLIILLLAGLLLNTELKRTVSALITQSHAVVGTPIDWQLMGYLGHIFGVHGGGWDLHLLQWDQQKQLLPKLLVPFIFYCIWIFIKNHSAYLCKRENLRRFLPHFIILIFLIIGLFYFRYFVKNPFPVGTGQSWSQFKLSDWAHPFASVLFLFILIKNFGKTKKFTSTIVVIFILSFCFSIFISKERLKIFVQEYGVHDVAQFYNDFRKTVLDVCSGKDIYLALEGPHSKFKQIASLYLIDQKIKADWANDDYIGSYLPEEKRKVPVRIGDCIVSPTQNAIKPHSAQQVGVYTVGITAEEDRLNLSTVQNAYPQESDGMNHWYWVEKDISFKLPPSVGHPSSLKSLIAFEYSVLSQQKIKITLVHQKGIQSFYIDSKSANNGQFQQKVNLAIESISEILMETNGTPQTLNKQDPRQANFLVRNLKLEKSLN